jgi:hypothetical protein
VPTRETPCRAKGTKTPRRWRCLVRDGWPEQCLTDILRGENLLTVGFLRCRWTRTQRIRTTAGVPVEAVIVDQAEVPVYLRIAGKAKHLRDLGMSDKAIARALRVSDKTVTKSLLPHADHSLDFAAAVEVGPESGASRDNGLGPQRQLAPPDEPSVPDLRQGPPRSQPSDDS